jgi:RsiW-degrading membrane proteinase PrsW (M82 family)
VKRVMTWLLMVALMATGLFGVVVYAAVMVVQDDRAEIARDYGSLFAFSAVAAFAGILSVAALAGRLPARVSIPNEWLSLFVFAGAVVGGLAIMLSDRFIELTPILALVAAVALFSFFAALVLRWSPERSVSSRGFLLPGVWGMIGAPLTAVVGQVVTAVMLVLGAYGGLYLADAQLVGDLEGWLTQAAETADFSLVQTPTITFGVIGLLGIAAPLTEELTKFLGVYILFRKRVATKYGLFIAGAAAGLGFAVVETLGYALMTSEQWPQVMLLRAPVTFIHVAATSIVALGWYMQRQTGRRWLIPFFGLAVFVHAAWNSLFVSMMILALGIENVETIPPSTVLLLLAVVSSLGAIMIASVLWIVGNARRLGREARSLSDSPYSPQLSPEIANAPT